MAIGQVTTRFYGRKWNLQIRGVEDHIKFIDFLYKKVIDSNSRTILMLRDIAMRNIKERTARGISVTGSLFQKYSNAYEKIKRKGFSEWLKFTGKMMDDMTSDIYHSNNGNYAKIYFREGKGRIKAAVHNNGMISGRQKRRFRMPKRRFFGLSVQERIALKNILRNDVYETVQNYQKNRKMF